VIDNHGFTWMIGMLREAIRSRTCYKGFDPLLSAQFLLVRWEREPQISRTNLDGSV
jgi:hypothetical protein